MIPTALALVVGAVVAAVLWLSVRELVRPVEAFERTNYRGAELVTGVGVVVPMAMIVVAGLAETDRPRRRLHPLLGPAGGAVVGGRRRAIRFSEWWTTSSESVNRVGSAVTSGLWRTAG